MVDNKVSCTSHRWRRVATSESSSEIRVYFVCALCSANLCLQVPHGTDVEGIRG